MDRRMTRAWAVGLLLAVAAMVGGCAHRPRSRPSWLATPGVRLGSGLLARQVFVEDDVLGWAVTDVALSPGPPKGNTGIVVAGVAGAVFLDEQGRVKRRVRFKDYGSHVDVVDVEGDGVCEFMDRGSWIGPSRLMSHDGSVRWAYSGSVGVDDMDAGDVDGDGRLEFAVSFNAGGGVHMLNSDGRLRWQRPDSNAWHVELMDTNGDGRPEVVNTNALGQLVVRDAGGRLLSQRRRWRYVGGFTAARWPTRASPEYVLTVAGDRIRMLYADGRVAGQLKAPHVGDLDLAWGVPVALTGGQPYFAVVATDSPWDRSALYVYDSKGGLAYFEVLAETCNSIAGLPLRGDGRETLFVGGDGRVWRYDLAGGAVAPPTPRGRPAGGR